MDYKFIIYIETYYSRTIKLTLDILLVLKRGRTKKINVHFWFFIQFPRLMWITLEAMNCVKSLSILGYFLI